MNLDGGGASALYLDGDFLELPGLPMANILAVYEK
jgi:exopolysaccharide biosynthesis protein